MTPEERKQKAMELHNKLHPDGGTKGLTSDNPMFLSFQALVEFVELLADVDNEAFTQLDKGKFSNPFVDETRQFATAIHFAEHPLDDIEEELAARGIKERTLLRTLVVPNSNVDSIVKESKNFMKVTDVGDGNSRIEEFEEKNIHFEIKPLKDYAKEWMRKRVPVNRERVNEIIKLAGAARIGEMANPVQQTKRELTPEMQRIRM